MTNMEEILLAAIKKAATNPNKMPVTARAMPIGMYWGTQYGIAAGVAGSAAAGGIATGAILSVGATAYHLRCVSRMTYAYGHRTGKPVHKEDFLAVLCLWLGKESDDAVGQSAAAFKVVRSQMVKKAAVDKVTARIGTALAERMATFAAKAMAAKIAATIISGAVPVIGAVAAAVLILRDFNKITSAIVEFYDSKPENDEQ